MCKIFGEHLGYIFEDESEPKVYRYYMNSVALDFKKER